MKITKQILLMVAMILFCCNTYTHAQNNDMMAKIAFESAEEALAAGNTHEAYDELNKVDSLLNKVTPKSCTEYKVHSTRTIYYPHPLFL